MQVTTEQPDPATLILEIDVDEVQISRAFDSVYKEFSRRVNVPGFRPGKAPRAVVERYVNKERVRERTREKVIQETFLKAIEEQAVQPYTNPEVDAGDIEDKAPFSYKVTVPLEPQVTLGEYTGLEVEKPIFAITDEMVTAKIDRLRDDKARLERVVDRGVVLGDVLICEVLAVDEGDDETAAARRQLVQVGNNIPGFDDAIAGMLPGDNRSFELTYPDDFDDVDKRGKRVSYTIDLISISARKRPDLDDEFAQQAMDVATVDEMKSAIRSNLEAEAARVSDQVAEQRLLEMIHSRSELFYPKVIIREELKDDLNKLGEDLRRHNVSYEKYLEQRGETSEQLQQAMAARAEARVRIVLILGKIAELEGLQATNDDIDSEFDRMLESGEISDIQHAEYKPVRHRRAQVANALVQQRLHEYLFKNNTIREKAEPISSEADDLEETSFEEV